MNGAKSTFHGSRTDGDISKKYPKSIEKRAAEYR